MLVPSGNTRGIEKSNAPSSSLSKIGEPGLDTELLLLTEVVELVEVLSALRDCLALIRAAELEPGVTGGVEIVGANYYNIK